ncbi:hypothetical protein AUJ78_00715 [Candidatus Peregrinibacteria bacterium CG1_02_41_10]|nr:MAG: hypothetical protein AUJ78_00715 [Candidatus Peregrinibacteria bacterium CG1_02_41_10]
MPRKKVSTWLFGLAFLILFLFPLLFKGGKGYESVLWAGFWVFILIATGLRHLKEVYFSLWRFLVSLFFVFLAGGLFALSFFFSTTRNFGFNELLLFWVGILVSLVVLFTDVELKKLVKILLILTGLTCLIGIIVYCFEPASRFVGTFLVFWEPPSFFPNALACWLLGLIPASWYFYWTSAKRAKWGWGVLLILMLASLVLTYSRAGWGIGVLELIVVIGVSQKLKFERRQTWWRAAVLILIPTAALVFGLNYWRGFNFPVESFLKKAVFHAEEQGVSWQERLDFWRGSLTLLKEVPTFGYGPYSFAFYWPRVQQELLVYSDHPHNLVLKILLEEGVIFTVVTFFWLLFVLIPKKKHWILLKSKENRFFIFLFLGLCALLSHNLIDFNLNFTSNALLFFVLIGGIGRFTLAQGVIRRIDLKQTRRVLCLIAMLIFLIVGHELYFGFWEKEGRRLKAEGSLAQAWLILEKAQPIWHKRNLPLNLAATASQLYQQTQATQWLEEELKILLNLKQLNQEDANLFNLWGWWNFQQGDLKAAEENFKHALTLNSLNNLGFYVNYFKVLAMGQKDRLIGKTSPYLKELLEVYADKLRVNAHFTILTANPKQALELYQLLIDFALPNQVNELLAKMRYLQELIQQERRKLEDTFKNYQMQTGELEEFNLNLPPLPEQFKKDRGILGG